MIPSTLVEHLVLHMSLRWHCLLQPSPTQRSTSELVSRSQSNPCSPLKKDDSKHKADMHIGHTTSMPSGQVHLAQAQMLL